MVVAFSTELDSQEMVKSQGRAINLRPLHQTFHSSDVDFPCYGLVMASVVERNVY